MKIASYLFLLVLGVFVGLNDSSAAEAQFWCRDQMTNEVLQVGPGSSDMGCVTDLVWGSRNVCFEGSALVLAEQINNQEYSWINEGLLMRSAVAEDSGDAITFLGIIQKDFYSSQFEIELCTEDFFN